MLRSWAFAVAAETPITSPRMTAGGAKPQANQPNRRLASETCSNAVRNMTGISFCFRRSRWCDEAQLGLAVHILHPQLWSAGYTAVLIALRSEATVDDHDACG